ncbi:formin-2-like [Prunus avium]|uniref:Formin-2-like n=1 Tax=Prunus avium TaxID=42229 RepID=A0A6P5ST27_PRUAV|nr:formin-2-like [Prunus avium]
MSWFLTVLFLIITLSLSTPSEASHEKKHPSAVVIGTVYCDTCFQAEFSHASHFISGASVGVECKDGSSKPSFQTEVKTDSHGVFRVQLPFSVSKHVKKIEGCSVKLISSSEPYCAVASTATSSSLHLKSRKQGTHIFSAGFFTFKPLKQPSLCNQKPSIQNSEEFSSQKFSFPPTDELTFPPPTQNPTIDDLPPLPTLPLPTLPLPPLPQLPPLPPLPGIPGIPGIPVLPPFPGKTTEAGQLTDKKVAHPDTFFPPNPFQQPSILPPNPLVPQPTPLIPNPFQPPPAPLIPNLPPIPGFTPPAGAAPLIPNLPPIPGFTPSPSPPPPSFPFLPPFPFPLPLPPTPRIPGIPPAYSSSSKQTTSP